MYLTVTVFLKTKERDVTILRRYRDAFRAEVERIVERFQKEDGIVFFPYKNVSNDISFYSKNQVLHFAEILYRKRCLFPNAQCLHLFSMSAKSFCLEQQRLVLNFGKDFASSPLYIDVDLHRQQLMRLSQGEIVKLDIKEEKRGYYAKVLVHMAEIERVIDKSISMGVDVGMRCPAVCYTSLGKICFAGNGREIRYHNRVNNVYLETNKENFSKLISFNHKARNYKAYIDHCISRQVVDFAVAQHVAIIKLEKLTNMQKRFQNHEQMCWSYERLQTFIKYKAELKGIQIVFVDPRLTSKRCPRCGKINNVRGRSYRCPCGFRKHRDIVGAMNILNAPEVSS